MILARTCSLVENFCLPAGADGCSLLVRNLSRSVTLDDLRYVAEKYGRLRDVYIPKDYYSG